MLTPPTVEPVTLSDAKAYLRVDFTDDDTLISDIISRARALCETVTARAFAPQQIREIFTIDRPQGGELSGPTAESPNWYNYQQQIGANPFGPAQFYFDFAMPPFDTTQAFTIQTKVVAFDPWLTFDQITNADGSTNTWVDNTSEPARLYVQSPITANFWKFEYYCGYGPNTYTLPYDLRQSLMEAISYFYDNREAEDLPDAIVKKLLSHRVGNAWI